MMNDIMVDLETLDNVASSAIVSIGAVQCDLTTGKTGEEYYRVIELQDQLDFGFTVNASTLNWWMKQSLGARSVFNVDGKILPIEMCNTFSMWLASLGNPDNFRMWGNGASFDNAILRYFYSKYGQIFPIPFWNDRDMRTIVGFYPQSLQKDWKIKNQRMGTYHNALDDAKYQVKYCTHILQELGVERLL
jgi:exodeoxyribonuclease VIII